MKVNGYLRRLGWSLLQRLLIGLTIRLLIYAYAETPLDHHDFLIDF